MLRQKNILALNQSVLLKGVNDCSDVLTTLSERLFSIGILPYYLHLLDKVSGTSHFDVPEERAKVIYQQLQANLSGYVYTLKLRSRGWLLKLYFK